MDSVIHLLNNCKGLVVSHGVVAMQMVRSNYHYVTHGENDDEKLFRRGGGQLLC